MHRKLLFFFFLCISNVLFGQTQQPSSLHPGTRPVLPDPQEYGPRYKKHKYGPSIETYDEYVARMKRTVKEKRKVARKMQKPRYSNPMYFGHKRPPKKHSPSRMRYCKECGIRH